MLDLFDKCGQSEAALRFAQARNRFFYSRAISPAAAPLTTRDGRGKGKRIIQEAMSNTKTPILNQCQTTDNPAWPLGRGRSLGIGHFLRRIQWLTPSTPGSPK